MKNHRRRQSKHILKQVWTCLQVRNSPRRRLRAWWTSCATPRMLRASPPSCVSWTQFISFIAIWVQKEPNISNGRKKKESEEVENNNIILIYSFLGKDVQERRCISNSLTKRNISGEQNRSEIKTFSHTLPSFCLKSSPWPSYNRLKRRSKFLNLR